MRSGRERVARLSFWASTFALMGTFVVWGPIVGYLAFGTAHAIEYIARHADGVLAHTSRPWERSQRI